MSIGILRGQVCRTFENLARLIRTALLPEHEAETGQDPGRMRPGLQHIAVAALGISVPTRPHMFVAFPLDAVRRAVARRQAGCSIGDFFPEPVEHECGLQPSLSGVKRATST